MIGLLAGEDTGAPARYAADSGIMVGKYKLGKVIGKGLSSEVRAYGNLRLDMR